MIMHNTNVRLPKAPIVLPIMDIRRFSVGHDFANLNTRSCEQKASGVTVNSGVERGMAVCLPNERNVTLIDRCNPLTGALPPTI